MRKINNSQLEQYKIEEAFRAGKAKEMVPKIIRVLGRRLGISFYNSDVDIMYPEEYKNATGKYEGYTVFTKDGSQAIRFNFLLDGKTDRIDTIDWFDKVDNKPKYSIDIPVQFNIIDVLDFIVAVIDGSYFTILEERISHKELLYEWLTENEELQRLMARRGGKDWEQIISDYNDYLVSRGIRLPIPSKVTFQMYLRQVFRNMNNNRAANNVPSVDVRRGQRETLINTDTESEQVFEENIIQNEHLEKYAYMEWLFEEVKKGNKEFNGIYLYGQGGIGKSYTAETMLKSLPNSFYFEGVIQGYTGLLNLLYEHRDNEIIILDDTLTDKMMKDTTIQNILKLAMLPDPPNRISVSGKRKKNDDDRETTGASMDTPVSSSSGEEMLDFTSEEGALGMEDVDSPESFEFNSWLIFITNYPEVPQPISDRTERIEFIFTNEQITDIIERALHACEPKDIDIEKKKFALDWIRNKLNSVGGNTTLSFRLFRRVAVLSVSAPPDKWETWALMQLQKGA